MIHADGLKWRDGSEHERSGPSAQPDLSFIPVGGVYVEVGAHVGATALRAAKVAVRVIAVEASPQTAETLRGNVALNGLRNVTVFALAAWDERCALRIAGPHPLSPENRTVDGYRPQAEIVPAWPLDTLLRDEPWVDVIRYDLGTADLHALNGSRRTLARCSPLLVLSERSEDAADLLHSLGYTPPDDSDPRIARRR